MISSQRAYGLYVAYDADDERSLRDAIIATQSRRPSRLVLDVPPGTQSAARVARLLLDAMGKDQTYAGEKVTAAHDWACAVAWARSLGVKEIVFLRAHLLTLQCFDAIAEFAIVLDAEATLVVVPHDFRSHQKYDLRLWPFVEIDVKSLLQGGDD